MNHLLTEPTSIVDAAAVVETCRGVLERCGFQSQAKALVGLEVFNATGAEVALLTLKGLPSVADVRADYAKSCAVRALVNALEMRKAS